MSHCQEFAVGPLARGQNHEQDRDGDRVWDAPDLDALLAGTATFPSGGRVIEINDERFLPPGDMPPDPPQRNATTAGHAV